MGIVAPILKKILLIRQNSSKKTFFAGDFTHFMSKSIQIWDHLFPLVFPTDWENLKILDIRLREMGATKRLNGVNKKRIFFLTFFAAVILDHFWAKFFKSEIIFFHYFSPRDSESLKILNIWLQEVWAKRRLSSTSKVNKWKKKKKQKEKKFRRGNFRPF